MVAYYIHIMDNVKCANNLYGNYFKMGMNKVGLHYESIMFVQILCVYVYTDTMYIECTVHILYTVK
jgi:hypothetical protein